MAPSCSKVGHIHNLPLGVVQSVRLAIDQGIYLHADKGIGIVLRMAYNTHLRLSDSLQTLLFKIYEIGKKNLDAPPKLLLQLIDEFYKFLLNNNLLRLSGIRYFLPTIPCREGKIVVCRYVEAAYNAINCGLVKVPRVQTRGVPIPQTASPTPEIIAKVIQYCLQYNLFMTNENGQLVVNSLGIML